MYLPQEAITRKHSVIVVFVMETIIYVITKAKIFCIIREGTSIPWKSINKHIKWGKSSDDTILGLLSRWLIFKSLWPSAFTWIHRSGMMTSSNGNIFRVTGPLCGEFIGPGEFPPQKPVTRSFDVFLDLRLNKRLSKQWWGWWFETSSWSSLRQCNGSTIVQAMLCCLTATNYYLNLWWLRINEAFLAFTWGWFYRICPRCV